MMHQTLERLRSGLHFSASALKTYLMCPWQFRMRYVVGATPEFRPSALILGSAVHEALAAYHRSLKSGSPLTEAEVLSAGTHNLARVWLDLADRYDHSGRDRLARFATPQKALRAARRN